MAGLTRFLVVLLLLALTNAGTFFFMHLRCREELAGQRRLQDLAGEQSGELQAELARTKAELERLSVWGDFIQLQQDLGAVDDQIDALNYGNALARLEAIAQGVSVGDYGATFRERRARLLPILEEARQALRQTDLAARGALIRFNEEAFSILSGIAAPPAGSAPRTTGPQSPPGDRPQPDGGAASDGMDGGPAPAQPSEALPEAPSSPAPERADQGPAR